MHHAYLRNRDAAETFFFFRDPGFMRTSKFRKEARTARTHTHSTQQTQRHARTHALARARSHDVNDLHSSGSEESGKRMCRVGSGQVPKSEQMTFGNPHRTDYTDSEKAFITEQV